MHSYRLFLFLSLIKATFAQIQIVGSPDLVTYEEITLNFEGLSDLQSSPTYDYYCLRSVNVNSFVLGLFEPIGPDFYLSKASLLTQDGPTTGSCTFEKI